MFVPLPNDFVCHGIVRPLRTRAFGVEFGDGTSVVYTS